MKHLIVYMSSHGTTEKVVHRLSPLLGYNTSTIINLRSEQPPSLDSFDSIIIGGSIHSGKIQKKIRKFCDSNITTLLNKKVGLFICYINENQEIEEFNNSFPKSLIDHAQAKGYFGGELLFEKMNLIEKFISRRLRGKKKNVHRINSQAINHFAIQMAG